MKNEMNELSKTDSVIAATPSITTILFEPSVTSTTFDVSGAGRTTTTISVVAHFATSDANMLSPTGRTVVVSPVPAAAQPPAMPMTTNTTADLSETTNADSTSPQRPLENDFAPQHRRPEHPHHPLGLGEGFESREEADDRQCQERWERRRKMLISRCVRMRVSMVLMFFAAMTFSVLIVAFPVWYITYIKQMETISTLSAEVRRNLITLTGTAIDQIFLSAERDMGFMLATISSEPTMEQLCSNWTDAVMEELMIATLHPVAKRFPLLRIGRAVPSRIIVAELVFDNLMKSVDDVWLLRFNRTADFCATRQKGDDHMIIRICSADSASLFTHPVELVYPLWPICPSGSVDGRTQILPIPANMVKDLVSFPVWEREQMFNPDGTASFSLDATLQCPSTMTRKSEITIINIHGGIATADFSATLAGAVQGNQRMFLALQRQDGLLFGTSHGRYWSHSGLPELSAELRATSQLWRWFSPQDCDDEIIHEVAASLYARTQTWDLTEVDVTVYALDQDWLVLSRSIVGPGRSAQLWLIQDSESLFGDVVRSRQISIIVFVIFIVGTIFMAFIISYLFARPLLKLQRSMGKISTNQYRDLLTEMQEFSRFREVYALEASFYAMLRTLISFSKYVPFNVIQESLQKGVPPQLCVDRRHISLMFLDICEFTQMMEGLTAETIERLLTHVFQEVSSVVSSNHGIIDKYIGDCVMALWGGVVEGGDAEEHQLFACRTAYQCFLSSRHKLRSVLFRSGLPMVRFQIGVHSGLAVVGNIGCQFRYSFTAIGDTVNVASRLQTLNKTFGTSILVSGTTAFLTDKEFAFAKLNPVRLIGRSDLLMVYELIGRCDDAAAQRVVGQWESAIGLYLDRQFLRAGLIFDELGAVAEPPCVQAAAFFVGQCRQFQLNGPPAEWVGEVVQERK